MISYFKSNKAKKDQKRDTVVRDRDHDVTLGLRDRDETEISKSVSRGMSRSIHLWKPVYVITTIKINAIIKNFVNFFMN